MLSRTLQMRLNLAFLSNPMQCLHIWSGCNLMKMLVISAQHLIHCSKSSFLFVECKTTSLVMLYSSRQTSKASHFFWFYCSVTIYNLGFLTSFTAASNLLSESNLILVARMTSRFRRFHQKGDMIMLKALRFHSKSSVHTNDIYFGGDHVCDCNFMKTVAETAQHLIHYHWSFRTFRIMLNEISFKVVHTNDIYFGGGGVKGVHKKW